MEINDIEHNSEIVDHTYLGDKNKLLKKFQKKHYMVALFDLGQNG